METIMLTREQLEQFKAEIEANVEANVLRKITRKPNCLERFESPWNRIKKEIMHQIEYSGRERVDSVGMAQLINLVSAVIRWRLGLQHIRFLTEEQFSEALETAQKVLELAGFEKKECRVE